MGLSDGLVAGGFSPEYVSTGSHPDVQTPARIAQHPGLWTVYRGMVTFAAKVRATLEPIDNAGSSYLSTGFTPEGTQLSMDLPEDIFQELTEGATKLPRTGEAAARTVPRVQATMTVTLIHLTGDKAARPQTATVRDISTRGVGLEFSEPIHVGCQFAIRLSRRDGSHLWLRCVSARWSPLDATLYSIGAKFVGIFTPAKAA